MEENMNSEESTLTGNEAISQPVQTESKVLGSSEVEIVSHRLLSEDAGDAGNTNGINVTFKNISGQHITALTCAATFYDEKGKAFENLEATISNCGTDRDYSIRLVTDKYLKVRSYSFKPVKIVLLPLPQVNGNDLLTVSGDSLIANESGTAVISATITNISDKTIARAVFKAEYLDYEGNIIDTVRYTETEILTDIPSNISIVSDNALFEQVKSYTLNLLKTISSDYEKILLLEHSISEAGNDRLITGKVKNISDVNADVVVIADFKDDYDEKIGTRIAVINDIEPGVSKQFSFVFNVTEGDTVAKYSLRVGEIVEEAKKTEEK
jgi:hypothetical protein